LSKNENYQGPALSTETLKISLQIYEEKHKTTNITINKQRHTLNK